MDLPFYVLSSGDESSESNSPNTSLSRSSHDASSAKYHIEDVKAFAEDLNQAAKSAFPNLGHSRYDTVNACLIRWEQDELNVHPELSRLNNKFQDYGFATNTWLIPNRDSHLELMSKAIDLIRGSDNDRNLFIVYYAGHGRINNARQAEWTCNRDPNYASVDWSAIQSLFAKAKSDVLILLDTCAAASSTMRSQYGVMEAIVACGFESRAAPPGEYSFTNTLIEVLDDWQNKRSFSASCLHAEILFQLKLKENRKGREGIKLEWCSTPIHINYTHDSKAPGIELCRRNVMSPPANSDIFPDRMSTFIDAMDLDVDDTHTTPSPILSLSASGEFQTPHVLIRIGLEQQQPPMDVKQCLRWLENIPILGKWATIEGVYPSYSTLLIISVPIAIWNMLPDNPACSFIGYVTAPSFTRSLPELNTSKTPTATASDPAYSDSFEGRTLEKEGNSYIPLPGSASSNPKEQQRYSEPTALSTPATSMLEKQRDFRKGEPSNKSWDKRTVPIALRAIWPPEFLKRRAFSPRAENMSYIEWIRGWEENFDGVDVDDQEVEEEDEGEGEGEGEGEEEEEEEEDIAHAGGLEKSGQIVQSLILDAPADDNNPTQRSSAQATGGAAWDQFAENERRFGSPTHYDNSIQTAKIDKSHSGQEQRTPDRTELTSYDSVSPELLARITEKVKRELFFSVFENLEQTGSGDGMLKAPPLQRTPSNKSSSSPPRPTSPCEPKDSGLFWGPINHVSASHKSQDALVQPSSFRRKERQNRQSDQRPDQDAYGINTTHVLSPLEAEYAELQNDPVENESSFVEGQGIGQFQCHCSQRFSRLDHLRQHAQTVHKNEETAQKISPRRPIRTYREWVNLGRIGNGTRNDITDTDKTH